MTAALSRITVSAADINAIAARHGTDTVDFDPAVETARRWVEVMRRDDQWAEADDLEALVKRIEQEEAR